MDKRLIQAFGRTLRTLRNGRNLSQEELGFKADLDRTFISMLERGVRQPTLTTFTRLAEVLQISATDFMRKVERQTGDARVLRAAEPHAKRR